MKKLKLTKDEVLEIQKSTNDSFTIRATINRDARNLCADLIALHEERVKDAETGVLLLQSLDNRIKFLEKTFKNCDLPVLTTAIKRILTFKYSANLEHFKQIVEEK